LELEKQRQEKEEAGKKSRSLELRPAPLKIRGKAKARGTPLGMTGLASIGRVRNPGRDNASRYAAPLQNLRAACSLRQAHCAPSKPSLVLPRNLWTN